MNRIFFSLIKEIILVILLILAFGLFCDYSYCDGVSGVVGNESVDDIFIAPFTTDDIQDPTEKPDYYKAGKAYNNDKFNTKVGKILGIIRNVGIVAFVIILMFIGVKFMYGSIEEKANYKETLIPLLIGAFLLLACTTIPEFIYKSIK